MRNAAILNQLQSMNIKASSVSEIRSKDGVFVYRVKSGDQSYVLKYFEKPEYRREIDNYLLLQKLSIPTIPLVAHSDAAILMEDLEESKDFRLALENDMNDFEVCTALGRWYRRLHDEGKAYIRQYGDGMYMETDCITAENVAFTKEKTATQDSPAWDYIEQNLEVLRKLIDNTEKTLTYNDFYYTNLAVAKNKKSALMFDYNLLGKGYVCSDMTNVTSALGDIGKEAFLESYGEYDSSDALLHEVAGLLVGLYSAICREVFPPWGYQELEKVKNGYLLEYAKKLLG